MQLEIDIAHYELGLIGYRNNLTLVQAIGELQDIEHKNAKDPEVPATSYCLGFLDGLLADIRKAARS